MWHSIMQCLMRVQTRNRRATARFELHEVFRSLQSLPEVDRAALLMHVQDEMPYAEIAAALGLSIGAVKVRIHRARFKLKMLQLGK